MPVHTSRRAADQYGHSYVVIGYNSLKSQGCTLGYTDTFDEACELKHNAKKDWPYVEKITIYKKDQHTPNAPTGINVPTITEAVKQNPQGPLFFISSINDSNQVITNEYTTSAEDADTAAARVFHAGGGKNRVLVFKLDKIAEPAIPKVEFVKAK